MQIKNLVILESDRQKLQEYLHKISAWSEMPFNVDKWYILKAGTRNQKYEYKMSGVMSGHRVWLTDISIIATF